MLLFLGKLSLMWCGLINVIFLINDSDNPVHFRVFKGRTILDFANHLTIERAPSEKSYIFKQLLAMHWMCVAASLALCPCGHCCSCVIVIINVLILFVIPDLMFITVVLVFMIAVLFRAVASLFIILFIVELHFAPCSSVRYCFSSLLQFFSSLVPFLNYCNSYAQRYSSLCSLLQFFFSTLWSLCISFILFISVVRFVH